jgi:hypothetical protein
VPSAVSRILDRLQVAVNDAALVRHLHGFG